MLLHDPLQLDAGSSYIHDGEKNTFLLS